MTITPYTGQVPSTGDPDNFPEATDTFLPWMVQAAGEMTSHLLAFGPGAPYCTVGGTANARTLTTGLGLTSLAAGQRFVFIPPAANTASTTFAIDGMAPVTGKTLSRVVTLPSGYLMAGVPTWAIWTGSELLIDRVPERGSNANGVYVRLADGSQVCTYDVSSASASSADSILGLYRTVLNYYTFPAAFAAPPACAGTPNAPGQNGLQLIVAANGATGWQLRWVGNASFSATATGGATLFAFGRWY